MVITPHAIKKKAWDAWSDNAQKAHTYTTSLRVTMKSL